MKNSVALFLMSSLSLLAASTSFAQSAAATPTAQSYKWVLEPGHPWFWPFLIAFWVVGFRIFLKMRFGPPRLWVGIVFFILISVAGSGQSPIPTMAALIGLGLLYHAKPRIFYSRYVPPASSLPTTTATSPSESVTEREIDITYSYPSGWIPQSEERGDNHLYRQSFINPDCSEAVPGLRESYRLEVLAIPDGRKTASEDELWRLMASNLGHLNLKVMQCGFIRFRDDVPVLWCETRAGAFPIKVTEIKLHFVVDGREVIFTYHAPVGRADHAYEHLHLFVATFTLGGARLTAVRTNP
jgi:hypothetical protein